MLLSLLRVPAHAARGQQDGSCRFLPGKVERIRDELTAFTSKLTVPDLEVIPISALAGDNVVTRSGNLPWY